MNTLTNRMPPLSQRVTFLAVIALLWLTSAQIAYAQRIASTAGSGTVQCGDYLSDRKQNRTPLDSLRVSWINGYVSAYNQFSTNAQVAIIPSPQTLLVFVDKYCSENPLSLVKHAADMLIMQLGGNLVTPGQGR